MGIIREKEYPPKVVAIYEAVISLMDEGIDVNHLKIADITRKAGIGKGTAYEYFSSKEEIIAGALRYEIKQLLHNLIELQEQEESFEAKIRVILDWIGSEFTKSRAFSRLIELGTGNYDIKPSLCGNNDKSLGWFTCQELNNIPDGDNAPDGHNMSAGYMEYVRFIDYLLEFGIAQGVVHDRGRFEGVAAISSQIISLVVYLATSQLYPEVTIRQAVDITYKNIMKLLEK